MANPRQRNKQRSGRQTKPSSNQKRRLQMKLKRAPPLKGPQVLSENWDRKKTVFQNYAALGLLPSIPLPTGASSSTTHRAPINLPSSSSSSGVNSEGGNEEVTPKVSYGRIIRDDQGNVIDIILDEEEDQGAKDGEGEVEGALNPVKEWVPEKVEAKTDVVRSLENLSAQSQPIKRHTSTSEKEWLRQLVTKHGDDYEKMSRDRSLNVWQKTPGEIKRMVKKAGGVGVLAK